MPCQLTALPDVQISSRERFPDMDSDELALFVQNAKVRLTAISGYIQMLEREVNESQISSEKQRKYVAKLRHLTDELVREIQQYEFDYPDKRKSEASADSDGSSDSRDSEDAMLV
jgi:hypothetical protein